MNYTDFEEQVQSIFQVKIKDDFLNKLFQGINSKISNLQLQLQEIKSIQQFNQDRNFQKSKNEEIVQQRIIHNKIQPLISKAQQLSSRIQQITKIQRGFPDQVQQKLNLFLNEKLQLFQQQRLSNSENLRLIKQEILQVVFSNQAVQKTLNDHIEQSNLKDQQYYFQIEKVWEVINGDAKQQKKVEPKKIRDPKHSIFYQLSERKQNKKKQVLLQSSLQKGKITTKGFIQPRKSITKQPSKIQIRRQSKNVEYTCLLLKVQALQRKMEDFMMIKHSQVKTKNTPEQQINSKLFMPKLNETSQRIVVERKKVKPSNSLSRLYRCSIARNENFNQEIDLSRDDYSQTNGVSLQLKKVNQKLVQLKYKYTLLQENYEIILNKISRVTQMESSINNKMDQIQKLRIDLSTINEINMRFRKIQSSYQQQEYKYVFNQIYTKDIKQFRDNIKDIEAKINKMANKGQVQEAFMFIETKIKQMALVLTDKFQSKKQGAINKIKQVKCLTCDKECDENYSHTRMSLTSPHCNRNIKTNNQFSRLKRKARVTQKKLKTEGSQNFEFSGLISKPIE